MVKSIKSNAEQVYVQLREQILQGTLLAGQNLRAAALSEEFGFGLTPLREALNRLQTEHLVTAKFNQGFRVAEITLPELQDLERTRGAIEGEMLSGALRLGDDVWESTLVASHYQLGKLPPPTLGCDNETRDLWETRHNAFHVAMTSGCNSPWLTRMSETVAAQRQRYHRNILRDVGELAIGRPQLAQDINEKLAEVMGLAGHTALMEAALARNETQVLALMATHVRLTSDAYTEFQILITTQTAA